MFAVQSQPAVGFTQKLALPPAGISVTPPSMVTGGSGLRPAGSDWVTMVTGYAQQLPASTSPTRATTNNREGTPWIAPGFSKRTAFRLIVFISIPFYVYTGFSPGRRARMAMFCLELLFNQNSYQTAMQRQSSCNQGNHVSDDPMSPSTLMKIRRRRPVEPGRRH